MRLLLTGIALLASINSAHAIVVVRDHNAVANIVVDAKAGDQVKTAARTLQTYIQKSTGATLPISNAKKGGINIHLGLNSGIAQWAQSNQAELKELDQEGFILQGIDDENFVIVGASDWGTEFGAYDFLERYLDVRWLMPTAIGEDVPQHATLDIPPAKVLQQPVYLSRQLSPINIASNNPLGLWGRFNRANGRSAFHHNMTRLLPVSRYGKTHPEFYPLIDGKRYIPTSDTDYRWQPNFSAPGIVDAAVEEIEKYFQANPNATSYSLGMNDSNAWDQSAASLARRNGRKNYLGIEDVSDDYFAWANAVVEKVLLKYPDKWFGTLAYNGIVEPPTKVRVHPRIVPFLTYDRMRWADPKLRDFGHELSLRWAKASPVLGWYDYAYGISYLTPRVYFHQMKEYLSWGAAHQVQFHYAELYPNWGEGPKGWVFARLLWNPEQDVDALLDEWYRHAVGPDAAPHLKEFYALWEKFWTVDIFKSKWNRDTGQFLPFKTEPSYLLDVPQEYIAQSDAFMQKTLTLADSPQRKARAAKLKEMWDFYRASILTYQAENLAGNLKLNDPQTQADALAVLDKAEAVMEQAELRQKLLTNFKADPLFASSADYITGYPPTAGQSWGFSLLWRLTDWAEKNAAVKQRIQQLATSGAPAIKKQAKLMLDVVEGNATPLLKNSSFENGIQSWVLWDKGNETSQYRKGDFTISQEIVKTGTQSLQILGLQRGAPMQGLPYHAGAHFARVSCYLPAPSKTGKATLTVQVLGAKSAPLSRGSQFSMPVTLRPGQWTTTVLPLDLPVDEKAVQLRFMVTLDGFGPEEKLYLDDAGIYRINQ